MGPEDDLKIITINRREFNILIEKFIDKCVNIIKETFEKVNFDFKNFPIKFVLTGGSSRIPLFREKIKTFFNVEPEVAFDPDDTISIGASLYSCYLSYKDPIKDESNTFSNLTQEKKKEGCCLLI